MVRAAVRIGMLAMTLMFAAAASAGDCITDWSVAAPLVKQGGLATVEQLSTMALSRLDGDIVKATLCEDQGKYVYRLVVRTPAGHLKTVTVDAHQPFKP